MSVTTTEYLPRSSLSGLVNVSLELRNQQRNRYSLTERVNSRSQERYPCKLPNLALCVPCHQGCVIN